nr:hypothetical protein [Tanacetum cinerariifolium]
MYEIDVQPIASRLLHNRMVHSEYLRSTEEQAATPREKVKQGKSQNLLNRSLDYARAEVYYECMEPFKSLKCLWVKSKSIAAIWLEKVVTPLIEATIKDVQLVLWYLDSGCSKNMIRDRSQLANFS